MDRPLTVIVRFTASLPDLPLIISSPSLTNPHTLSTLIRPHLPPQLFSCSFRLIYSGALLPPKSPLSESLRLSRTGKSPAQVYIHCSISADTHLSSADLEAEAKAAVLLQTESLQSHDDKSTRRSVYSVEPTVQPAPQGFDRLLSAGLSPTEIASLRSQFIATQAHTRTPDTMPSQSEMRSLEERWLDADTPSTGRRLDGAEVEADDEGGGGLEDMLWGNLMGFFWALGAIVWLVREEGVWSSRRKIGVATGVLVNIAFCILKIGS